MVLQRHLRTEELARGDPFLLWTEALLAFESSQQRLRVNFSSLTEWGYRLGAYWDRATWLDFCDFRDLVLPDGNRVSAFSVASTAIAAAQWSSTQVRWRMVSFFKVVWWFPKSQKLSFLWRLRSSPRAALGSTSWLLSLMFTNLAYVSSSFGIL